MGRIKCSLLFLVVALSAGALVSCNEAPSNSAAGRKKVGPSTTVTDSSSVPTDEFSPTSTPSIGTSTIPAPTTTFARSQSPQPSSAIPQTTSATAAPTSTTTTVHVTTTTSCLNYTYKNQLSTDWSTVRGWSDRLSVASFGISLSLEEGLGKAAWNIRQTQIYDNAVSGLDACQVVRWTFYPPCFQFYSSLCGTEPLYGPR